jgi:hypothetical protein
MTEPRDRKPAIVFALLCVILIVALAAYILSTRHSRMQPAPAANTSAASAPVEAVGAQPHMVFRNTALGSTYGRAALAPLDAPSSQRAATPLACDRVHFAGGHGVCLASNRGVVTTYRAVTFDEHFAAGHEISLPGVPSRVRVSPDGTRAGITVFVSGDSYAAGGFSTRALLVDIATGDTVGHLEEFAITRDGRPFKAQDFNFWGITFADADRFYATLGTGGETYLVEARASTRQGRVLRAGVECPSLSPDRTRVVFKKRTTSALRLVWRPAVLELASGRETVLAETRSVDDQSEWFDNDHVAYGLPSESTPGSTDVWIVPADGTGTPRMLARDAWSPAFVR